MQAEVFHCARVSLGALGVLSTVTLQAVPAFRLHAIEEPVRLEAVLEDLDDLADSNDHYEFYWVPHTKWCLTKRNNRTEDQPGGRTGWTYLRDKYLLGEPRFRHCGEGRQAQPPARQEGGVDHPRHRAAPSTSTGRTGSSRAPGTCASSRWNTAFRGPRCVIA